MKFTLGISILGMICFLSLMVKTFRLYQIKQAMEAFIKTRSMLEFKRVSFLGEILNNYQQYVKLNRKEFDTKLLIKRFYNEDRIAKIPVWLLDSIIDYGAIILILAGLAGSIFQLLYMELQTKSQITLILWPTLFSLGVSICFFILQMILGTDMKKEKIFTRLEEYMDNHYRFHIESDISRNSMETTQEIGINLREIHETGEMPISASEESIDWEAVDKGIGHLEEILADLDELLEPTNITTSPALQMDEKFIEEMIYQVLQGN